MTDYSHIGTISVRIDDFTPCLKSASTGELVDTEVIRIRRKSFLSSYNIRNGGIPIGLLSLTMQRFTLS